MPDAGSRASILVKLVERKGEYNKHLREICGIHDHLAAKVLVDASAMRSAKGDLDHATATLEVWSGNSEH